MALSIWLTAMRLRTLPLALGSMAAGFAIVPAGHPIDWTVAALTLGTMLLLQILSNIANDYGDGLSGVDNHQRQGPQRVLQGGMVTPKQLRTAISLLVLLSAISGGALLYLALPAWKEILVFLGIGALSIVAAITYTVGKKPYGYVGLGDLSVLIFFGFVAVIGTAYLQSNQLFLLDLLPALSVGMLAVAVLNINNIRDIETDLQAGKRTMAARLGQRNALIYHCLLVSLALAGMHCYLWLHKAPYAVILSLTIPAFIWHGFQLFKVTDKTRYNLLLKTMVLLAFSVDVIFFLASQLQS
ncbi:MAG: 1,4-dihydroxy-2-naphthoate octaprenyltransferase [Hahellaceae bacterium]|nr:1,4-dihydroxy-2-naphthoate octaprenyltransferase [Hahellaceae bacterium]MCP5212317.1 1,4-dihydroxy-2-naphthoate octaprenyltransferase [Hahellaceae bacterium]